jgi:hypothetical protein
MSGLAHGNRSTMLMMLEHEPIGPGDAIGVSYGMTSSLFVFAHIVRRRVGRSGTRRP